MSKIEWTGETWNPIVGCSIVSPGCTNCYAMRMAARMEAIGDAAVKAGRTVPGPHYAGTTKWVNGKPVWTGKVALAPDHILTLPLRRRTPTTYFVNSMSDLFHESVPDEWINRVFAVMALCPQHTFQVLTKRSARMRAYCASASTCVRVLDAMFDMADAAAREAKRAGHPRPWEERPGKVPFLDDPDAHWPLSNVWLGVSAEDQRRADERIPDLLATPAAVRFVSAEPLLGAIRLNEWMAAENTRRLVGAKPGLSWIIVGGESGPGARPMHPDWARSIRDQCQHAGVAFFFKQWGAWEAALDRDKDDPDWRLDYNSADYEHRGRSAWLNLGGGSGFHGERFHVMRNVGKARAGRLLDGREWNEMPDTTPVPSAEVVT